MIMIELPYQMAIPSAVIIAEGRLGRIEWAAVKISVPNTIASENKMSPSADRRMHKMRASSGSVATLGA